MNTISDQHQNSVKKNSANGSISSYRNDFPILNQSINGQKLVYLDSAIIFDSAERDRKSVV